MYFNLESQHNIHVSTKLPTLLNTVLNISLNIFHYLLLNKPLVLIDYRSNYYCLCILYEIFFLKTDALITCVIDVCETATKKKNKNR